MEKLLLTKDAAIELLHQNIENKNLRKHCYAVGKVLSAYHDYYKSRGKNTGTLSKDQWEITGILHDADWEKTADEPKIHTLKLLEWLEKYDVPEEMLQVFKSHNNRSTHLREPETIFEWTLECCDELTGFIVAVALMRPNKKLSEVEVSSVLKKFKHKEFARAVDRNQISQCEEKLGIKLEEFVQISLKAMQENSDLLGL